MNSKFKEYPTNIYRSRNMLKWMVSNRAVGADYLKVEDDQMSDTTQKDVEKGVFTITR